MFIALHFSGVLDRLLNIPGGTLAGITGSLSVFVFGYSLLTPWILAAIVLYVAIVGTGIMFWGPIGRDIDRAIVAADEARAIALLRSPRNIAQPSGERRLRRAGRADDPAPGDLNSGRGFCRLLAILSIALASS